MFAFDEDIVSGDIAYVNNAWVSEDYQSGDVAIQLEEKFKDRFKDCKYVARKRFKYNESFKVYPMVK